VLTSSKENNSSVYKNWQPTNCLTASKKNYNYINNNYSTFNNNNNNTKSNRVLWQYHKLQMSDSDLYKYLVQYSLSYEQLINYGYPVESLEIEDKAFIYTPEIYQDNSVIGPRRTANGATYRRCCRCKTEYKVKASGENASNEACVYHWGKMVRVNPADVNSCEYTCCHGDRVSSGCVVGKCHVSAGVQNGLQEGFIKTRPRRNYPADGNFGIFAVDCEMCFTTQGLELTKVTLVTPEGKIYYDALVKPENPIIDYNTRFSGLSAKDLRGVTKSLRDVQYELTKMVSADTILIGHSLENDLRALRLIHGTIVDTSIVFPHNWGPPYRRSLKSLVSIYLKKEIQESENGHDSKEDALASLELILWKVGHDMRTVCC